MKININRVEADEEVDKGLLLGSRDVLQEGVGDGLTRGEGCVDGEAKFEGFGVDIANVNTAFVSEKDVVAFASGVDANVIFGIGWVREERFDDEVVERAGNGLNLKAEGDQVK